MMSRLGLRGGLCAVLFSALTVGCVTTPIDIPDTATSTPSLSTANADTANVHAASLRTNRERPRRQISLSPTERDPDRLRRLDPDAVMALIGNPGYIRHEGGAIIWQYMADSCVMDLFWYRTGDGLTLLHYETRSPRLPRQVEAKVCFTDLLTRRTAAIES
ncbi:MAG: hypothetical protein HQ481_17300 [Alphaproteobacteria bacterium]|nr:hypothetical protein [Alphaproteobacteria bacterium]